jgi:hypothetical protein
MDSFCFLTWLDRRVFPVSSADNPYSLTSLFDKFWFIADRHDLKVAFKGKLPLLTCAIERIKRMTSLRKLLGLEARMLSGLAREVLSTSGGFELHAECTKLIRGKAGIFAR